MNEITQALKDIQYVRSILERVARESRQQSYSARLTEMLIQGGALSAAGAILFSELWDGGLPTRILLLSAANPLLRVLGLVLAACVLLFLIGGLYSVLFFGARKEGEAYQEYVARNFARFSRLSFASDLLVKFICVAALILIGQPQFITPLLMVFTADYLFQGRFFLYSVRTSILLGASCLAAAVLLASLEVSSLLPAVALFSVIAAGSTAISVQSCKRAQNAAQPEER